MAHHTQVSVLSQLYLQQAEEMRARSWEIWGVAASVKKRKQQSAFKTDSYQESSKGMEVFATSIWILDWTACRTRYWIWYWDYEYKTKHGCDLRPTIWYSNSKPWVIEDILSGELTFRSGHQRCHIRFVDTVRGGTNNNPWENIRRKRHYHQCQFTILLPWTTKNQQDSALPHKNSEKIWEPKISKLKGGYTSSGR